MPSTNTNTEKYTMDPTQSSASGSGGPPPIQSSPSAGSASLAYSMDTDAMMDLASSGRSNPSSGSGSGSGSNQQQRAREEQLPPRIQPSPSAAEESVDYSIYSSGEMSAEQYYAHHGGQYNQYQEQTSQQERHHQGGRQEGEGGLSTVNEYYQTHHAGESNDATQTVHDMHRKLLYLLSHPELFSDAMEWQSKVDRGLDPSKPDSGEISVDGIKSFDNEFNEDQSRNTAAEEHKDEVVTEDGSAQQTTSDGATAAGDDTSASKYKDQQRLIPPLPLQIFAPDAEVVLPQALTASQLFGIERVTGIELEAAAGIIGLSQLFLRWLALMPEGDHMNIIDPPGLTVMRISGGRYRVTGAHRVVWRWMNKFSPASTFTIPSDIQPTESMEEDAAKPDTDFDFGDLVTMTIIDVFETDIDGRLLSYCPTFDNRAVHKTQEAVERIRKGASHFKERMEVVARSPAGKSVNKAAENFGKMSLSAAFAMGNIVKSKIEEEIHKHQHPEQQQGGGGGGGVSEASSDAVGGEDVEEEEDEAQGASKDGEHSAATPGTNNSRGEGYFSDDSTAASPRRMQV